MILHCEGIPRASTQTHANDFRELLHTKNRREEAYEKLQNVLGDSVTSCEIDSATDDMSSCLQASALLPPLVLERIFSLDLVEEQLSRSSSNSNLSVTMDNSLSPVHTLIQIHCVDHKGLLYDIMRTLKDCNIQVIAVYRSLTFIFYFFGIYIE